MVLAGSHSVTPSDRCSDSIVADPSCFDESLRRPLRLSRAESWRFCSLRTFRFLNNCHTIFSKERNTTMSTELVPRSKFEVTALTRDEALEIIGVGQTVGTFTEIDGITKGELGKVSAQAAATLAEILVGMTNLTEHLNAQGTIREKWDESMDMLFTVSRQNILTLTHETQQAQVQVAASSYHRG